MKNAKITMERVKSILDLQNQGKSVREIAKLRNETRGGIAVILSACSVYQSKGSLPKQGNLRKILPILWGQGETADVQPDQFQTLEHAFTVFQQAVESFIDQQVQYRSQAQIAQKQEEINTLTQELLMTKEIVEVAKKSNLTNGLKRRWGLI